MLIDLEVLYYLRINDGPIHRYLHTYVGGIAMGLVAAAGTCVAAAVAMRMLRFKPQWLERLRSTPAGTLLREAVVAGLVGGVSHILLDSCMHQDMNPLWPFASGNALAGIVTVRTLHVSLAAAGFFGIVLWLLGREP